MGYTSKLDANYRVTHHTLLVIDELDLTLHTAALKELIKVMCYESSKPDRNLQIVFTSHRQELMKKPLCNIRFIINTDVKTFCLSNPTEDCYEQLSGEAEKYLKIYVEDDVARAIVNRCLLECGMSIHANVCRFGSVTNIVRLALGLACQYTDLDEMNDILFLGDGDVKEFTQEELIRAQTNQVLSGGEQHILDKKEKVIEIIKHLNPTSENGRELSPEEVIHKAFLNYSDIKGFSEIVKDSNAIIDVVDHHNYVNKLLEKGHLMENIVAAFAETSEWSSYTSDLTLWILQRKNVHKVSSR